MTQSLLILGRQPALGLAELERLYGAAALESVGTQAALMHVSSDRVAFARLGSSVKLCEVLKIIETTDWQTVQSQIVTTGSRLGAALPEGKIQIGLSAYDLKLSPAQLTAAGLELKKALRKLGRSVRLTPNQERALNSAQVWHNHLTGERGLELVLVKHGSRTILARTVAEQDIAAYTMRDRGRPKRDARVGMLPPKLAQTIVNLATGPANPLYGDVVLDPFCGTGVILQEATLMGFDIYGSDLEPRMVEYTDQNLMWLLGQPNCPVSRPPEYRDDPAWRYFSLEVGDATTHHWKYSPAFVASETYLGRPLTAIPSPAELQKIIGTCNVIIEKFLKNIGGQLRSGTTLCLAMPAWQTRSQHFVHLPLLDHLSNLGYNRIDFKHARPSELIYYRPDQVVGRELVVITRK